VAGDFNGDANPDLLWQNASTGNLKATLMAGIKPMAPAAINPLGPGDASLVAVGSDDFDGDHKTDILFWRAADGMMVIWHMDGLELLYKTELEARMPDYRPVSVLDFNRDGRPDILFQERKGGDIIAWLLENTRVVGRLRVSLPAAEIQTAWRVGGSGDFDRDGDADLVLYYEVPTVESRGTWNTIVAVALMDGAVGTVTPVAEVADRNWLLRGVADISMDGWPDIVWENHVTGFISVWVMDGLTVTTMEGIPTTSSTERGWHIVGPR
jgi:hypothetical protein